MRIVHVFLVGMVIILIGLLSIVVPYGNPSGAFEKSSGVGATLFITVGAFLILAVAVVERKYGDIAQGLRFWEERGSRPNVTNRVKDYPILEKLSESSMEDASVRREVSYLSRRLRSGKLHGEGSEGHVMQGHVEGTKDIEYLWLRGRSGDEHRKGSMLFFRQRRAGEYEIVAASTRDKIDKAEGELRNVFGKRKSSGEGDDK